MDYCALMSTDRVNRALRIILFKPLKNSKGCEDRVEPRTNQPWSQRPQGIRSQELASRSLQTRRTF